MTLDVEKERCCRQQQRTFVLPDGQRVTVRVRRSKGGFRMKLGSEWCFLSNKLTWSEAWAAVATHCQRLGLDIRGG